MVNVLLAAPISTSSDSGIGRWASIVSHRATSYPSIRLTFLDTSVTWRSSTNRWFPIRCMGGSLQAIRDASRMKFMLKSNKFDIFHLCTSGGLATVKDIGLLALAKQAGMTSVLHYHMGRLPKVISENGIEWKLTQKAIASADVTVALDTQSKTSVNSHIKNINIMTLPNMVDIDLIDSVGEKQAYPTSSCSTKRIVYIGHVIPDKGMNELVEACSRLVHRGLVLDIVGQYKSDYRQKLITLAEKTGHTDWLHFRGLHQWEKAIGYLHAADLFVFPSYSEGAPNSILEAMVCRKPIVTTPVGAIPEILDFGGANQCGIPVGVGNVEVLTSAIEQFFYEPDIYAALGLKARERVEKVYSTRVAFQKLAGLWTSVVSDNEAFKGSKLSFA